MLLIFAILTSCALWAQDYVSGVSTEAISLPAAPGSVEGLPATINESGNKGQFRYSIEIKIPKGVNGLQPQLNLSYNSQAGQSEFGLGWSLDIATIERSTKKGVPTYSETDNFWGPDGELLKIDRLGDGTQFYAPYISKVQNLYEYDATTNTWVLHRIDGSKLYFGENLADSSIQTELGVFRWFIEKQVDSIGNEITYSYNKISGHPVLEAISYAYKTGTPFYQVKFQYENRPDPIISYKSNERITQTKRCTEIRVESPGNHIIRSYEFNYAPLAPGLGSTLVSIQQRGVAGADADSAMPPLEFDYSKIDLEADFKTIKLDFADSEIFPPSLNKNRATIVDIDRDSFPDLIETSRFGMKVWLNDRANGFLPHYKVESFISLLGEGQAKLVDVDGDRVVDFLSTGLYPQFYKGGVSYGAGQLGFSSTPVATTSLPRYSIGSANVKTMDINADGRLDIIAREVDNFKTFISSSEGNWDRARDFVVNTGAFDLGSRYSFVADMNGDGLSDLVFVREKAVIYLANKGTGEFDQPVSMAIEPEALVLKLFKIGKFNFVIDLNGDGLDDLVAASEQGVAVAFNLGNDSFGETIHLTNVHETEFDLKGLHITTADLNGNGSQDILWTNDFHDYRYLDFSAIQPNLLVEVRNGLGLKTEIEYALASSFGTNGDAEEALLPHPMTVVKKIKEVLIPSNTVTREDNLEYFGGYYQPLENDFRGFHLVHKTETGDSSVDALLTRTFYQQGRSLGTDSLQLLPLKTTKIDIATSEIMLEEEFTLTALSTFTSLDDKAPVIPYAQTTLIKEGDSDSETSMRQHKLERVLTLDSEGYIEKDTQLIYQDLTTLLRKEETKLATVNIQTNFIGNRVCEKTITNLANDVLWSERYHYDLQDTCEVTLGLMTQKSAWNGSSYETKATYTYKSFGSLASFTDSLSHTTSIDYDTQNLYPTLVTNAEGHTKSVTYDAANGTVATSTDENSLTTAYDYDPYLRLTKITGPADSSTYPTLELVYSFGNEAGVYSSLITKKREKSGVAGTFDTKDYFDGKGRSSAKVTEGPTDRYVLDRTTYNSRGEKHLEYQKSFVSNFNFPSSMSAVKAKETRYDSLKRPVLIFNPEHTVSVPSYKEFFHLVGETITYDEERKVSYEYRDANGRRVGMKDALENEVSYEFDPLDQLIKITDPQGSETLFGFDTQKRRTCKLDPTVGLNLYTYNTENLVTQKDMYGFVSGHTNCTAPIGVTPRTVNFEYNDDLNRRTKVDYPTGSSTPDLSFTYDSTSVTYGIGKLTGTSFGAGSKVIEYDIYGNKKKSILTIGANTYTTEWLYNVLGQIEKVIYPTIGANTLTVRNEYDAGSNLIAVRDDGTNSPFTSGMLWTPLNQLEAADYGNNTKTTMSYDDTDQSWRLQNILTEKIGTPNTTLQEINYSYDKVSNIIERDDVKNSFTEEYEFDDLHRLVEADLNGTSKTWAFDEIGNITSNNGTSYTYSGTRKQIVAAVGSDSYTFDNFGNITTDASRAYSFNWENRLASVTKSSVTTVYDYDEEGIRVKKTTPSKVTQYIDKYTEIDDTDVIRHIFAGNKRIASIDGAAAVTYNHEDHLGSSNIRTDASGSVIKSIEYLPFGEKRTQSGSYNTIKNRFTGQYEDEESDLYYYQQRYYDPILSRFITADPLYLEEMEKRGTDTQELNVYAYVRNNPVIYIDEKGLNLSFYDLDAAIHYADILEKVKSTDKGAEIVKALENSPVNHTIRVDRELNGPGVVIEMWKEVVLNPTAELPALNKAPYSDTKPTDLVRVLGHELSHMESPTLSETETVDVENEIATPIDGRTREEY